jgi:uncharacterized membrane protein
MWQQWVNGILGIWLIIVPYLGFSTSTETTVIVITGIVVAILGFWGALTTSQRM